MKVCRWLSTILVLSYSCALTPAFKKTKVVERAITDTTHLLNSQQRMSDQQAASYGAVAVVVNHETETELQSAVGDARLSQDQVGLLFNIAEGGSGPNSNRESSTQENFAKPQAHNDPLVEQLGSLTMFASSDLVPPASTSAHSSGIHSALAQQILTQTHLGTSKTDSSLTRLELRRGSSGDIASRRRANKPQQPQQVVGGPSENKHRKNQRSKSCGDLDFIAQQLQQESQQSSGGVGLVAAPETPSPELQRAGSVTRSQRGGQVKNQAFVQATPETGFLGRESVWKKIRGALLLYSVLSAIGIVHGLVNNNVSQGAWNQPFYSTSWLEWELGAGFNLFAVIVGAALHYKMNVLQLMSPMIQQLVGIPLAAACCSAGQLLGETVPLHVGWRNVAVNVWAAGLGVWYVAQALRLAWGPSHLPPQGVNHGLNEDLGEGL